MKLVSRVRTFIAYFDEVSKCGSVLQKSKSKKSGFLSRDKFIKTFLDMYSNEDSPIQNTLVLGVLKCFVAKANGHTNVKYNKKVESFILALASVNKSAFEFVSGNLGLMGERQVRRLSSKQREQPYVSLAKENIIKRIVKQVGMIRTKTGDTAGAKRIAFSLGVDATACVSRYDRLNSGQAIVGGASPHHFIDISGLSSDEIKLKLQSLIKGELGVLAKEIKICVISFQRTPNGISPYLILCGLPQTINKSNNYANDIIDAW